MFTIYLNFDNKNVLLYTKDTNDTFVSKLKDKEAMNRLSGKKVLFAAGVAGVMRPSKSAVQVIVGTKVQFVADEMKKVL